MNIPAAALIISPLFFSVYCSSFVDLLEDDWEADPAIQQILCQEHNVDSKSSE